MVNSVKSFIRKHPIWSGVIGIVVFLLFIGIVFGEEEPTQQREAADSKPRASGDDSGPARPSARVLAASERQVERNVKRELRKIGNKNEIGPPLIDVACPEKSLKRDGDGWALKCKVGLVLASIPGESIVEDEWLVLIPKRGKRTVQLESDYQLNQFYVADKTLDCSGAAAFVGVQPDASVIELAEAVEPCVP